MDAFNAEYSTTYEIDEEIRHSTTMENFKKFLEFVQENDLVVDGAMTDPKGNRGLGTARTAGSGYVRQNQRKSERTVSSYAVRNATRPVPSTPTGIWLCRHRR